MADQPSSSSSRQQPPPPPPPSSSSTSIYPPIFTSKPRPPAPPTPSSSSASSQPASSMEAIKRYLAAQQLNGQQQQQSQPSSSSSIHSSPRPPGKYKGDTAPKTKMLFQPSDPIHRSPSKPTPQQQAQQPPIAPFTASAGPTFGPLLDPLSPNFGSGSGSGVDDAALLNAPDYSHLDPSERDKAIQDMMNQAVAVDDDYDPEDARVPGMAVPLMRHQTQGYKWMKQREAGKYKGGILADDMGLGKTIQALCLIVGNSATGKGSTIKYVVEEKDKGKKLLKKRKEKEAREKARRKNEEEEADEVANVSASSSEEDSDDDREEVELRGTTTLIVAPVAVLRQWETEAKTKTDCGLRVFVHHGTAKASTASVFKKYDIVLTSFPTAASEYSNVAANDGDRRNSPLFKARWLRVILDEAHNIKNHTTKQALACFELARRAHSKWCLTGTPLQNNALEMFSLIHFLGIPPFDDYHHFKEKIADPLKSTNQNRVNWGMKRLCVVLQTILLRRTKDTKVDGKPLLTLPDRIVETVSEPFDNDEERDFYKGWEDQARRNLDREKNHIGKLLLLLRMRQATSHPSLVTKNIKADADAVAVDAERTKRPKAKPAAGAASGGGSKASAITVEDEDDSGDELADLLNNMRVDKAKCTRCQCVLEDDDLDHRNHGDDSDASQSASNGDTTLYCSECKSILADEAGRHLDWTRLGSTKLRIMLRLLNTIDAESNRTEKTIIFSQFTTFLDLVQRSLDEAGRRYVRYDGSMTAAKREAALEKIRSDAKTRIILISFKAGSTGLNLTCCSRVLLMDLWWNPMLEEQGMDRAHRVGQTRAVRMYKICIQDTVEQRILDLQEKKRELSRAALEGSKLKKGGNKLSLKELMYLFNGGAGEDPPVPGDELPKARARGGGGAAAYQV